MFSLEFRPMSADPSSHSQSDLLSQPDVSVSFTLHADSSPGLLSRLLQPYAKRDLVPDRVSSHRSGETMHVEIAMEAMPAEMVHLVEGNLRQVVGVRNVVRVAESWLRQVA
jgi:hypothetical protein